MLALLFLPISGHAAAAFEFNNGRLPEAAKMLEAMCGVNVETRALVIKAERWTHKVITFVYPTGSNHLWVWDPQTKAREIKAPSEEPLAIAKALLKEVAPKEQVLSASFTSEDAPGQCSK